MQKQTATENLQKFINDKRTPGLQYLFVDENSTLFQYQDGLADIRLNIPVTPDTTFTGYSITKTFTAAAVANLALQNKIDLDQPIDSYINDLKIADGPTVRQTLQHQGGFPNPNPLSWIHLADQTTEFDERAFINELLKKHTKLLHRPGDKFAYSNVGYIVLGELVHQVSGMPYDKYVDTLLIKPLELADNQTISYSIDNPGQHAKGHIRRWTWLNLVLGWIIDRNRYLEKGINGWVPFKNILVNGKAYGGLIGNASGFARYLQAMLRHEEPYTQKLLDTMWQPAYTNDGKLTRIGLAWRHGTLNDHRYFTMTGGAGGYYCEIRIYPDIKRASVIMTNNTSISGQNYLDNIDSFLLSN